jgi:predicted O-methyltransferase YrrM
VLSPLFLKTRRMAKNKLDKVSAISGIEKHIWTSEKQVGELISSLIKLNNGKHVLESGVFKGQTSIYMIDALPNDGSYTGVDIEDLREDVVRDFMDMNGNCKFIKGDSLQVLKDLPKNHYDLIFIDSVHEEDFLRQEFKLAEQLVKVNGLIVLHDAYTYGVNKWIEYVKQFPWFEIINLDTCDDWGNNRGVAVVKCKHGK